MRVADDERSEDGPVAIAPAPESAPETSTTPDTFRTQGTPSEIPPAQQDTSVQGYAPYGQEGAGPAGNVDIRRIGQWTNTGINEARRMVIRDANGWAKFWSELGVGERPAVDFTRDLVIAVAAGQQPTGGHGIAVSRVGQNNGELTIEVVVTSPGPNCMTTSSLTQPVDIVVVPGVNAKGWSFVERADVRGCR